MMQLAWLTDVHFNFIDDEKIRALAASISADAAVITGDISEAPSLIHHLEVFREAASAPIFFVLGNHDFYRGSLEEVHEAVRALTKRGGPSWLPEIGVVELTTDTALLGCDGWGDARLGDFMGSPVMLNDYILISELRIADRARLQARLFAEGDRWGDWVRTHLPPVLEKYSRVIFATHVPPFEGACWHEGKISDQDWLPHFTCKAVGDALLECAAAYPRRRITVLCGHTHGAGTMQAADNVEVWTGGAQYGAPRVERVLELL